MEMASFSLLPVAFDELSSPQAQKSIADAAKVAVKKYFMVPPKHLSICVMMESTNEEGAKNAVFYTF
jgi:hypothetical protein